MKVRLCGVRGSIPSPGPTTAKYGGNTTCIEVVTDEGDRIILDGGSGIRPLGERLMAELPVKCSIFFTHTHWDHIQGLPFFIPLFVPNNDIDFFGAFDPVYLKDLKEILARQMEYCYFPVRECELKANLTYHTLREGEVVKIGSATISNVLMNHPVLNFGYRIESHGKSIFFTGDHEPLYNIYDPEDDYYEEYQDLIKQKNQMILDVIEGVDVLIADSSYTTEEYPMKRGWGHGTWEKSLAMAREAKAKNVVFTHHEPTRSDDELEEIFAKLKADNPHQEGDPNLFIAKEDMIFDL